MSIFGREILEVKSSKVIQNKNKDYNYNIF